MAEKFSHEIIEQNLNEIRANIECAAKEFGRSADSVKLLAATKTVDADTVNFAISKGVRYIGENRVQELLEKYDKYDLANAELHFIGRLQTNKVKYIIDKVKLIHSVDSLHLAEEIDRQAAKHDLCMDILVEVNAAGEASKGGVGYDEVYQLLEGIARLENVHVKGLMTIPPKLVLPAEGTLTCGCSEKIYKNREFFNKILHLFLDISEKKLDNIDMYELSAGMSDDYEEAVHNGSTMVRLGRAIFGERQ